MNLLLLSLSPAAVPHFLDRCVGKAPADLRLAYIPDAGTGMPFADLERAGIDALGYDVVEVRARDADAERFAALLATVDAVYVASGETFVLLEALRSNGTGEVLAEGVRHGLPYIGCSAGSIIAGSSITPAELMDDRHAAPQLHSDTGLGLIDEVVVPHADGRLPPYPPELIERIVTGYGDRFPLLLLHDDQALAVTEERMEIITGTWRNPHSSTPR